MSHLQCPASVRLAEISGAELPGVIWRERPEDHNLQTWSLEASIGVWEATETPRVTWTGNSSRPLVADVIAVKSISEREVEVRGQL